MTENDTGDADSGPNEALNFPVGVTQAYVPETGVTRISGLVETPDPSSITVDVYGLSSVDGSGTGHGSRYGEGRVFLGTANPEPSGAFVVRVPGLVAQPFVSATATDAAGSTSEFSAVCGDPDANGLTDNDADGLCDDWEKEGLDYNGDGVVDLPLNHPPYDADPGRKDVYVEVDFMESGRDHGHAPDRGALQDVVDVFAAAPVDGGKGIALHLSPGPGGLIDEAVPEIETIRFASEGPGPLDDFNDIKLGERGVACDGHLGTVAERGAPNCAELVGAKKLTFRYAVFGHAHRGTVSGLSEIGGDDFIVTLGKWTDTSIANGGGGLGNTGQSCVTLAACRRVVEAGTFMHELGHTLGLRHGGDDGISYKPNYLSVMNYTLQTAGVVSGRPLDFSRWKLPTLSESALSDADGIGGQRPPADLAARFPDTAFTSFDAADDQCKWADASTTGAVDWNFNGTFNTVPAGINDPDAKDCQVSTGETLTGFDDWANLDYLFRDSLSFGDGASDPEPPPDELTGEQVTEMAERADFDGDGHSNAHDVCPATPNPDQADADSDRIGDACVVLVENIDLSLSNIPAPRFVPPHQNTTFTITVTNEWPITAPGVEVSVELPKDAPVSSVVPSQGSFDRVTGLWRVGAIPKRSSATLRARVTIPRRAGFSATAEITASGLPDVDSTPGNGDRYEDDVATAEVKGAPGFAVVDLGGLGGTQGSEPYAINDSGQVVGGSALPNDGTSSADPYHAFLWERGQMRDIGALYGVGAAGAVNAAGVAVGSVGIPPGAGYGRAGLFKNGSVSDLGTPAGDYASGAGGINDAEQVVGTSEGATHNHAFFWENGTMSNLGTLGGLDAGAAAINDSGVVVGFSTLSATGPRHAFRWTAGGGMVDLGTLPGDRASEAAAISDGGRIVGRSSGAAHGRAFLMSGGSMTALETLGGYDDSHATDVNDRGQVIGYASRVTPGEGTTQAAFLYDDGEMFDLNDLVTSGVKWRLERAYGINAAGQIVGVGSGPARNHGWLLTPIGPPAVNPLPASVSFGEQLTGVSTAPRRVMIENTGSGPLEIAEIRLEGDAAGDFGFNMPALPVIVEPKQTVSLDVAFTPASVGARTARLVLADNAATSPQTVPLSGIGRTPQGGGTPAADTSAPGLDVRVRSRFDLRAAVRHGIFLRARCSEACDLRSQLVLGRASKPVIVGRGLRGSRALEWRS